MRTIDQAFNALARRVQVLFLFVVAADEQNSIAVLVERLERQVDSIGDFSENRVEIDLESSRPLCISVDAIATLFTIATVASAGIDDAFSPINAFIAAIVVVAAIAAIVVIL